MWVLIFNSCCYVLACVLIMGVCPSLLSLHGHRFPLPVLLLSLLSVWMFFSRSSRVRAESAETCSDPAWELLHSLIRDLSRASAVSAYEWLCSAGSSRQLIGC